MVEKKVRPAAFARKKNYLQSRAELEARLKLVGLLHIIVLRC